MTDQPTDDPVDISHWREVFKLLAAMNEEIAALYADRGVDLRPTHSMVLIRLHRRGPMTIRQLADSVEVTHSAMSQKVAALRRSGHVRSVEGADARTRPVELTDKGAGVVAFLEAEWRATEAAVAQLDGEVPYPLGRVGQDLAQALRRKGFRARIEEQLARGQQ